MRRSYYTLIGVLVMSIIGCGSSSDTRSEIQPTVLVSDAYVVNAVLTSGNVTANERHDLGPGWYQFATAVSQTMMVSYGVNDINPPNSLADAGEPYSPALRAPVNYKNITPLTTMLMNIGVQNMQKRYPNAYDYDPYFDFDVVTLSEQNLLIAKENTKAAFELSAAGPLRKVVNLRIINGSKVQVDDPTWKPIVSLQHFNSHFCGGTLIDEEWILTAAHCLVDYDGNVQTNLPVTLTDTYSLDVGGVYVDVKAAFVHQKFNSETLDNDIALMHLAVPVTTVPIIALNHRMLKGGTMVKVAGWGNTLTEGSNYPVDLMQVTMPVIELETCNESYQTLSENMLCAGYMDGSKDSCQGDSGGPLIYFENGQYLLSGIVSFGGTEIEPCGALDYPGVYTRVSKYIEWIEGYTGSLGSSSSSSIISSSVSSSSSKSSLSSSVSTSISSSSLSSSSSFFSSSSSSSHPSLDEIFIQIDEAEDLDELNLIIIDYMGYYNGVYPD